MKIKELIKILESNTNHEAEVNLIGNVINSEDSDEDFDCDFEVQHTDNFYQDFIEILVMPKNELNHLISMHIPQSERGNFLNTEKTIAINSYGESFMVGCEVGNEGAENETAVIESFES